MFHNLLLSFDDVIKEMYGGISPDSSIREVARVMACMNIRRVAITENGKVIGMFTSSDLARLACKSPLGLRDMRRSGLSLWKVFPI